PELQARFVAALRRLGVSEMRMPERTISYEEYVELPRRFDPVGFDARAWARLAREAGQRYLVLTTKHHDGFCMFDSRHTDYKVTNAPFGRDVVAELGQACADEGVAFGVYYSCPDIHHPGYRDTARPLPSNFGGEPSRPEWPGYLDYMEDQLTELLTNYRSTCGDLFVVWWDLGQNP